MRVYVSINMKHLPGLRDILEADDKNSWSLDQTRWRSKAEFLFEYKEILSNTFESALEQSIESLFHLEGGRFVER
jgi:hypothetical protein